MSVGEFFSASGDFAFEPTTREFTLSDGSTVETDVLLLGANDTEVKRYAEIIETLFGVGAEEGI